MDYLIRLRPGGRVKAHARREPLYTLVEISDRVSIPVSALRAYLSSVREEAPAPLAKTACSYGIGRVALYRMSEFRRWMEHNQIASKYLANSTGSKRDSAR